METPTHMGAIAAGSDTPTPAPRSGGQELGLAVLYGAATWLGLLLAQRLSDPYAEPRLTLTHWLNGGG